MKSTGNGLVNEKSPYLLQHARNPVAWYPWGDEAFAKAKREDKPIFLSVGYSTCHWCHVMARESFENEHVAALLNNWFVSIKVDREERPDIDQLYMTAVRLLTGGGGWPMSVFLFPDGRPFYGGTYFPPRAVGDQVGFMDIVAAIHRAWGEKHENLATTADSVVQALKRTPQGHGGLEQRLHDKAYEQLVVDFDSLSGGFGEAPKFPSPGHLNFLLNYWYRTGEQQGLEMVSATLRAMGRGGIFDHLGGGFHRYSVDSHWFLPHFEKMIYDQSLLATVYLDGYLACKDPFFSTVARRTLDYMVRDMRHPQGGIYSAEDADSVEPHGSGAGKQEGAYYVWTREEIVETVEAKASDLFCYWYGIEPEGNVSNDPRGEFLSKNILSLVHDDEEAATRFELDPREAEGVIAQARQRLYEKRLERIRPQRDDKVITAWNGLAIKAFAKGAAVFWDPSLLRVARECAGFIREFLWDENRRRLMRRYREGSVGVAGQLDDYAFLISGLLQLYFVTQEVVWLDWALTLSETQEQLFWDQEQSGYFNVAADNDLLLRLKGDHDGAEPAANSVAVENLQILSAITGDARWRERANETVDYFSDTLNRYPSMLLQMLSSYGLEHGGHTRVVIAGKRDAADTLEFMRAAFSGFHPDLIVLLADGGENQKRLSGFDPFIAELAPSDGSATAYLCRDYACEEPISDPEKLRSVLHHSGAKS